MQAKWQAKLAKILKNLIKSQGYFRNRFNKNYWAKKLRDDMNSNYNLIRNNKLQANISKFGFLVLVNNISATTFDFSWDTQEGSRLYLKVIKI